MRRPALGSAFPVALTVALTACVSPAALRKDLGAAEEVLAQARVLHGSACAPIPFADAEASVSFAVTDMEEGDANRARRHADEALTAAQAALDASAVCGKVDQDSDGIADVVDLCPIEAEDKDGVADDDGCRDIEASGDDDKDGIRNIDDDCPDFAEDFDGDVDDDGCPETSTDGDGDGVIDLSDACPAEAEDLDGFKDDDGCPDADNDGDTLPDLRDVCPNAPEDLDKFEDEDGCPEEDNDRDGVRDLLDNCPDQPGVASSKGCPAQDQDRDGVSDADDRCPTEPETVNQWLDDDGCPDAASARVRIGRTKLELVEPILFVGDTAELDSASTPLLSEIARALAEIPGVAIRIEGHTEAMPDEEAAQLLSLKRAQAVSDWLVRQGMRSDRFEIAGLGSSHPIDTNRTSTGRARNRRIELLLVR